MTTDSRLEDVPGEAVPETGDLPAEETPDEAAPRRPGWRRVLSWELTTLACLLMLFALLAPNDLNRYDLWAFLRIPVEGVVALAVVLFLPAGARRIAAVVIGVLLGLLSILKVADMGFHRVLFKPFDPVLDWFFIEAGVDYVGTTMGRFVQITAVVGAVLFVVAMPVFMALAALRLTRIVNRHRAAASHTVRALAIVWIILAVLGVPVAGWSAAEYTYLHAQQIPGGIRDAREFAKEVEVDAFRDLSGDRLLTALRGKDVMLTFVESYGRSAIEHPEMAPEVSAVLDAGAQRLAAAGFAARSGFLTSSTVGGGSWLAHATVSSGLRIDNQARYRNLVTTDRLTLNRAFQRAGWRTVGLEPVISQAWPEGQFFGYDKIYTEKSFGYRGPRFSYATMPDQFILSAFQRFERGPGHAPLMAQITLLSSHAPFTPVPRLLDWAEVGDGSVYNSQASAGAPPEAIFQRASVQVRADYGSSIVYSLDTVLSYLEKYGDENLVMVFLGDHQPAPYVSESPNRDVPITIVARDPAVLDKVAGWGWQPGLKPNPQAPVWPMDTFRDQFLRAFS